MTITYIHHSGYLLETEQALLLFAFLLQINANPPA